MLSLDEDGKEDGEGGGKDAAMSESAVLNLLCGLRQLLAQGGSYKGAVRVVKDFETS